MSRVAPAACRGSAMGVYNTFQFSGVFFGGALGGITYGAFGELAVFVLCGLLLILWAWLVYSAPPLKLLDSLVVSVARAAGVDCEQELEAVEGVEEAIIIASEETAYLKVDKSRLDQAALDAILEPKN